MFRTLVVLSGKRLLTHLACIRRAANSAIGLER